jgi:hypothetical protein
MQSRYVGKHRRKRTGHLRPLLTAILLVAVVAGMVLLIPSQLSVEASAGGAPAMPDPAPARHSAPVEHRKPAVERFDIVAAGDLLIHTPIWERAATPSGFDFRPMFAAIRPIVRGAALALCHVETPIGDGSPSSYPLFDAPAELAGAIRWTGFDACDTASNHTLDRGQQGIDATLHALDRAGVRHTGSYRSEAASRRILMLDVRGVKIAYLAYSYGTNGIPMPNPWSVNLISLERIRADAARARRLGAGIVIVNFHWGTEYQHTPNTQQVELANTLLGEHVVDVIVGQHVHVVQPIEEVHGRFVVFGEGNLISSQGAGCCPLESQDGLIAVIHVVASGGRARVTGVDYIPTWVEHPDYRVLPVPRELAAVEARGQGQGVLAGALRASMLRTVAYAGQGPRIRPLLGASAGR